MYGERKGASRILEGKHDRKRPLTKAGRRRGILKRWIFRK
jgi:hypothetical protein